MATFKSTCTRDIGKKVATTSNGGVGWTTIPDGREVANITIDIDVAALLKWLGPKAMRNKARKTKLAGGDIVVRATNIRRVP